MTKLKLYHYWRSTSSWRVRFGMAIKNIECEFIPVSLLNGESESEEHLKRNPFGYVPVLEISDAIGSHSKNAEVNKSTIENPNKKYLTESLAILNYLEALFPNPALFPSDPYLKAHTLSLAEIINADTQPIQNLSVLEYYSDDPLLRKKWATHFIDNGLRAYEKCAEPLSGRFSVGDSLTLSDLCLIPQLYNAMRQEMDLNQYPLLKKIWDNAIKEPSFIKSHPDSFNPETLLSCTLPQKTHE